LEFVFQKSLLMYIHIILEHPKLLLFSPCEGLPVSVRRFLIQVGQPHSLGNSPPEHSSLQCVLQAVTIKYISNNTEHPNDWYRRCPLWQPSSSSASRVTWGAGRSVSGLWGGRVQPPG
jgi:hypothetical protein